MPSMSPTSPFRLPSPALLASTLGASTSPLLSTSLKVILRFRVFNTSIGVLHSSGVSFLGLFISTSFSTVFVSCEMLCVSIHTLDISVGFLQAFGSSDRCLVASISVIASVSMLGPSLHPLNMSIWPQGYPPRLL
ncbi:hypothetical protein SCLCIDRAFT_32999 [Scleroderma citrinum Foug A]|uniref:Uncharacterized protein n=1 Tax=Scleroderma citrinum Foug A TaxID=1036808 RepID=A0A0C2ZGL2_9AGAM|nr:hypothetical protein SCLCIDRAFT_32999 [Scleroderma citrinum Foug A]